MSDAVLFHRPLYCASVSIALYKCRWFDGRLSLQWHIAATDDSQSIIPVSTGLCFHSCYVCSRRFVLRCLLLVWMKMLVLS